MTPTEAFNANLSQQSDSIVVRGKLFYRQSTTTTPSNLLSLYPDSQEFGSRIEAFQNIYSRFRLKSLKVKFMSGLNESTALGILDDGAPITGQVPTTYSAVAEMRCSGSKLFQVTVPVEFEWKPLDPKKWYYTQLVAGEPRCQALVISGLRQAPPLQLM